MGGEHTPLATRFHEIEDGIPYLTQIIFSFSFLQIQDFLDNLPCVSSKSVEYIKLFQVW